MSPTSVGSEFRDDLQRSERLFGPAIEAPGMGKCMLEPPSMLKPAIHEKLLAVIALVSKDPSSEFPRKSKAVVKFVDGLGRADLMALLNNSGVIPEVYGHDSSEEKLYAKAMDSIVAASMKLLGYDSTVYVERSNKADVGARWTGNQAHSVVLDAKAFRLSRTAKNPKDYKIEALNAWRAADRATYACLVAPAGGFPIGNSRLYAEATTYNVALISFSHLRFALDHGIKGKDGLRKVLDVPTLPRS